MPNFLAEIVGGGPHDGNTLVTAFPPMHAACVVAPDGCVYEFNDKTCRWVFRRQQKGSVRRIE